MRLRALAPGKVNLGLRLGPTRGDGRHELVTVFQSVSLADELTLETLASGASDEVHCPGVEGDNLALRALVSLRARGWEGPPVRIEIVKRVPVAAGMGGGSADAAAALRLAAALHRVAPETLEEVAAGLGADVPAQLAPGLALGIGAGEIAEPLPALASHAYVILPGTESLATPAVFGAADRLGLPRPAGDLVTYEAQVRAAARAGARLPDELLINDLEPAAVDLQPAIADALERIRVSGADCAFICGSGPTVAGLFWGRDGAERAAAAADELGKPAGTASPIEPGAASPSPG
jgi:4-diphosphocytidyl-2-C-methyl-D-erythritol kinase